MARRIRAASIGEIRDGRGTLVAIEGLEIAIFRYEGSYFAINNVCSHQHFSVLHPGTFDRCRVECPMHGWTYDVRTGRGTEGRVARYEVTVTGESIFVELPDE